MPGAIFGEVASRSDALQMGFEPKSKLRKHPAHQVIEAANRPTIVFVTVCTKGRRPILANAKVHDSLKDIWRSAGAWMVGRYVIMPDHLHLFAGLGSPQLPLTNWVSYWKRAFTRAHGEAIWLDDYWDTTLRDSAHAAERWEYIRQNPVRHGFVADADAWPWQGELNDLPWP